jgi:nucleotide-binding universal stress UspA family protein
MYQRIVVPVDHSAAAQAAFREAVQLAQLTGARLKLLHVEDVSRAALAPVGLPGIEYVNYTESHDASLAYSEKLLEYLQREAEAAGLVCEHALIEKWGGSPARTLLDAATAWHADLIVMGTHGYSGFMHLIFGSVAESLLHHAKVPVLLVRGTEDDDDDE